MVLILLHFCADGQGDVSLVRKKYTGEKDGRFLGAEPLVHCLGIGRSSVFSAFKKPTEAGLILSFAESSQDFLHTRILPLPDHQEARRCA